MILVWKCCEIHSSHCDVHGLASCELGSCEHWWLMASLFDISHNFFFFSFFLKLRCMRQVFFFTNLNRKKNILNCILPWKNISLPKNARQLICQKCVPKCMESSACSNSVVHNVGIQINCICLVMKSEAFVPWHPQLCNELSVANLISFSLHSVQRIQQQHDKVDWMTEVSTALKWQTIKKRIARDVQTTHKRIQRPFKRHKSWLQSQNPHIEKRQTSECNVCVYVFRSTHYDTIKWRTKWQCLCKNKNYDNGQSQWK